MPILQTIFELFPLNTFGDWIVGTLSLLYYGNIWLLSISLADLAKDHEMEDGELIANSPNIGQAPFGVILSLSSVFLTFVVFGLAMFYLGSIGKLLIKLFV